MSESDRPPLGAYAYEEIAKKRHEIELAYRQELAAMRIERSISIPMLGLTDSSLPPPKQPEHVRVKIIQFAGSLLRTEAYEYPAAPEIELWLSNLVERVVERVMNIIAPLNEVSPNLSRMTQLLPLTWHGITPEEMREAARLGAEADMKESLRRLQPEIAQEAIENPMTETPSAEGIVEQRERLLSEYKAAAGNPSNKRIYEASNSGIHKPEFYQWKRGELPTNSRTTIGFEAFLKAKKRPIPQKPTT